METASTVKHYKTKDDYLQKRVARPSATSGAELAKDAKAPVEAEKVDISKKAKDLKNSIKEDGKEIGRASKHLLKDAGVSLAKAIVSPLPIPSISLGGGAETPVAAKAEKAAPVKEKSDVPINKPGIFLISGLELGTFSSDDQGLPELASAITGAEHFSWKDEDKVMEEILRRTKDQPIILIGHSLGGDAAVNIANNLNTLKGGFRKVNLLVTLDSVGFGNDIIPQNVGKNLNFISDDDYFFNDGPNIARDSKRTTVDNILRSEGHRAIDEASDVHFEIMENIDSVMSEFKKNKKFQRLSELYESFKKTEKNSEAIEPKV
ncbi:lipase family protein [Bacteriovorax sp. Seq25_V]|uniref:lipase family protein n=1 Tax=Bacteriovorax sp. Seq25_V TaxID=1201288 RepID=UPI00038A35AE|nr:lipase family protein [Bacteriovorax sp. Seq25_V]EQC45638.1 hypothetical protein M900_2274 [Bacteriovorax sp. Seq25_V]